jgi:murein DD-endopeptidase MepM/ murein hydrolase activator NlpD
MYRLLLFIVGTFFIAHVYAQDTLLLPLSIDTSSLGPTNDEEYEEEETPVNSSNNLYYSPKYIDNLYQVPAYNQYLFWDTTDIHPYGSKMNLFEETKKLPLKSENSNFCFPVKGNKINSEFGWRRWKYHYGIDLGVNVGDSVFSCFDGMVRIAQLSKSYGYTVVVRHYNGLETLYAHLSKLLVHPNQEIKAGELIALSGNTGHSTGPHLHLETRYIGGPINPRQIINFETQTLNSDTLIVNNNLFSYLTEVHKARYLTVKKGDSLGKLAHRYGVSVSRLCKLNGIKRKKLLKKGQKLRYT